MSPISVDTDQTIFFAYNGQQNLMDHPVLRLVLEKLESKAIEVYRSKMIKNCKGQVEFHHLLASEDHNSQLQLAAGITFELYHLHIRNRHILESMPGLGWGRSYVELARLRDDNVVYFTYMDFIRDGLKKLMPVLEGVFPQFEVMMDVSEPGMELARLVMADSPMEVSRKRVRAATAAAENDPGGEFVIFDDNVAELTPSDAGRPEKRMRLGAFSGLHTDIIKIELPERAEMEIEDVAMEQAELEDPEL